MKVGVDWMEKDNYQDFAGRYDWMISENPKRKSFFKNIFSKYRVKKALDCSCGTGADLLMINSLGVDISGSDLSDAMLKAAQNKIRKSGHKIRLKKADFRKLTKIFKDKFDAVLCLSSSICEIHPDKEVIESLRSMKSVLNPGGLLIIDQGQSDKMMISKPRFIPIVNTRDFTRFYVLDYSGSFVMVNVCDFEHSKSGNNFSMNSFKLKVRLFKEWKSLFKKAGFSNVIFYGGWDRALYNIKKSGRIIIVAKK